MPELQPPLEGGDDGAYQDCGSQPRPGGKRRGDPAFFSELTLTVEPPLPIVMPHVEDAAAAAHSREHRRTPGSCEADRSGRARAAPDAGRSSPPHYFVSEKYLEHRRRLWRRHVPFERLRVRSKATILPPPMAGISSDFDPASSGNVLSPAEWHEMMNVVADNIEAPPHGARARGNQRTRMVPLVLDVRNDYEAAIGRFRGAVPVGTNAYTETGEALDAMLEHERRDRPLMIYCTGGIRCVQVGAYLRSKGFADVNQLRGGIVGYARHLYDMVHKMPGAARGGNGHGGDADADGEQPMGGTGAGKGDALLAESHFRGSCVVFDQRYAVRVTSDVLGHCEECRAACDVFHQCAYPRCNRPFLQCPGCLSAAHSCCSSECERLFFADAKPWERQESH